MLASIANSQGLLSASHAECMNAGRIQPVLVGSSMRSSARRSASSLMTLFMPSACAGTAWPRSAVMCASRPVIGQQTERQDAQCIALGGLKAVPDTSALSQRGRERLHLSA